MTNACIPRPFAPNSISIHEDLNSRLRVSTAESTPHLGLLAAHLICSCRLLSDHSMAMAACDLLQMTACICLNSYDEDLSRFLPPSSHCSISIGTYKGNRKKAHVHTAGTYIQSGRTATFGLTISRMALRERARRSTAYNKKLVCCRR